MAQFFILPYFEIIQWVLIIQIAIIGFHVLFALIIAPMIRASAERKQKENAFLRGKLLTCIQQRSEWSSLKIPSYLCTIPFLLPTMIKIDEEMKDAHWDKMKAAIFKTLLLPRAQKLTYAKRWTKRIQAVGCFLFIADKTNEPYLLDLLRDSTPIIQYSAAYSAAKLGTAPCANAIIDEMNQVNRFLRLPFHEALSRGDPQIFQHLESRLENDTNSYAQVSCLEVLSDHMNAHVAELARKDLYTTNKNLRLAAIRALGHYSNPQSVSSLISLLKDPEWEIRAIAARSLGYLGAKEALSELSLLLKDKIWWVRMNSAIALKRLGNEGKKILEEQKDPHAYEIAQYVLKLTNYE